MEEFSSIFSDEAFLRCHFSDADASQLFSLASQVMALRSGKCRAGGTNIRRKPKKKTADQVESEENDAAIAASASPLPGLTTTPSEASASPAVAIAPPSAELLSSSSSSIAAAAVPPLTFPARLLSYPRCILFEASDDEGEDVKDGTHENSEERGASAAGTTFAAAVGHPIAAQASRSDPPLRGRGEVGEEAAASVAEAAATTAVDGEASSSPSSMSSEDFSCPFVPPPPIALIVLRRRPRRERGDAARVHVNKGEESDGRSTPNSARSRVSSVVASADEKGEEIEGGCPSSRSETASSESESYTDGEESEEGEGKGKDELTEPAAAAWDSLPNEDDG